MPGLKQGSEQKSVTMLSSAPVGGAGGYLVHLVAEVDMSTSPPTVIQRRGAVVLGADGRIVFGGSMAGALAVADHLARGEAIALAALERAEEDPAMGDEDAAPFTM